MRVVLFSFTVFLASALLFAAEPMFAKMILPLLGGSPAVWNTCLVFFQACLLAGYLYAHLLTRLLDAKVGAVVHVVLFALPLIFMPILISNNWQPPANANPIFWLLKLLALTIGPAFVMLTTTSPLLQRWFAGTSRQSSESPYFLYAAGNLGSVLALLSYPFLIEPSLRLATQSRVWTAAYLALFLMILGCGLIVWKRARPVLADSTRAPSELTARPKRSQRLVWIILTMVPSSYLLGVTTYITTEIAAVPLLWIVPLAIYLLTFISAFSRPDPPLRRTMALLLPPVICAVVLWMLAEVSSPAWLLLGSHLLAFGVVCMVCHGELARRKPHADHLTEYYLWIALGGMLGGMFNALIAPFVFDRAAEYPIVIALSCLLVPSRDTRLGGRFSTLDLFIPLVVAAVTIGVLVVLRTLPPQASAAHVLIASFPILLCFSARKRPLRFGLCIACALAAFWFDADRRNDLLLARRSFFGVHTVVRGRTETGQFNELFHGSTLHGRQRIDLTTLQPTAPREPLTYYHRTGPIGRLLDAAIGSEAIHNPPLQIALVGLGIGSLGAFAEPDARMTYYEIDPLVLWIADQSWRFSYLADARSRGAPVNVIIGDARLTLRRAPDHSIDILVLDAFSGDAIPVHLLTREAFGMYLAKLRENGVIAIHVSNRYLDLEPVIARLAAEFGCACVSWRDVRISREDGLAGKTASEWIALSPDRVRLEGLTTGNGNWRPSPANPAQELWTDDFSNILSVFRTDDTAAK